MTITVKIQYDKLKKLSPQALEGKKNYWLKRLYENKYEEDKLYINFQNAELKALIKILSEDE